MRGHWQCERCFKQAKGQRLNTRQRAQPCKGFSQHVAAAVGATSGHRIVALQVARQPYLLCLRCGSYGIAHLINLRQRCRGEMSVFGQRARRALLLGKLPKATARQTTSAA